MEIDGITAGKLAAEMQERGAEIGFDGELMARGGRCILALSSLIASAVGADRRGEDRPNISKGFELDPDLDLGPGKIVEAERPPLGLRPVWVVATKRIEEIQAAMARYVDADVKIPGEWFEELESQSRMLDRSRENRKI